MKTASRVRSWMRLIWRRPVLAFVTFTLTVSVALFAQEDPSPAIPSAANAETTPDEVAAKPRQPAPQEWNLLQAGYENGLLTVYADHSTLADVLAAIRQLTGAEMEIPERTQGERIMVKAGPAPADAVLAQILNGSNFDYVIVGSPENPKQIQKILLLSRAASPKQPEAAPVVAIAAPPGIAEPQAYGVGFSVDPAEAETPASETGDQAEAATRERQIPAEVLDQMQKLRIQQRQLMQQMQQPAPAPPIE